MATVTRRVYVLGLDVQGNREVDIIDEADVNVYTLDEAAIVTYSSADTQFPYELV